MNEARKLGWPPGTYLPQTLEEKIVTYADKLVEGFRIVPIEVTLHKFSKDLGTNHSSITRIKALHEEFSVIMRDFNAQGLTT
jgi:uncharacterized protein